MAAELDNVRKDIADLLDWVLSLDEDVIKLNGRMDENEIDLDKLSKRVDEILRALDAPASSGVPWEAQMVNKITSHFNDVELEGLCLDMDLNPAELAGGGITARAIQLVLYCERRGLAPALVSQCRRLRPLVERWPAYPQKE